MLKEIRGMAHEGIRLGATRLRFLGDIDSDAHKRFEIEKFLDFDTV